MPPISAGASTVETSGSIGIIIGVVVGVIIALVLALVLMRRRRLLNDHVRPAAPTGGQAKADKKAAKKAAGDLFT
jgi:MFS superfamily sulfate permease-like transporter